MRQIVTQIPYRIGRNVQVSFAWMFFVLAMLTANYVWADDGNGRTPPVISQEMRNAKLWLRERSAPIGNSSIWISKDDLTALKAQGTLPAMFSVVGAITSADIPVVRMLLAPYLDPNFIKNHPAPRWYKPDADDTGYNVGLDSEGGDVGAAIEIGRMFRKARVFASLGPQDKCLSACVFLLAGSVRRFNNGPVGIHRPYSSSTSSTSYESMQENTLKLGELVRTYLIQMNIPDDLYEDMRRVPPEQIKVLSPDELDRYGLNADDPVFAELNDNREANLAGVSKTEFLHRKALSKQCLKEGYWRLSRANNNGEIDIFELAKIRNECDLKTIYKDVVDESGNWRGTPADQYCLKLEEAAATAIGDRDWRKVLEVGKEREQNCAEKMTANDLADSINDQADASLQLGNPQEAVSTANRCVRISKNPFCHITKGSALLQLSKRREGIKEIHLGKRLADQEVSRLRVELQRASSESETKHLKAELDYYQSRARLAQAILTQESARSSP